VRERVQGLLNRLEQLVDKAIRSTPNARPIDTAQLARVVVRFTRGLAVMERAGYSRKQLKQAAATFVDALVGGARVTVQKLVTDSLPQHAEWPRGVRHQPSSQAFKPTRSTSLATYKEEHTMTSEREAPETKGVTVKLLATVDLGPEIEGMEGRQLRMRMVTIAPGGVFGPVHDHKGRPGTVYILQGTITDHRNGVATDYGPGVGWPEDRNTTHWLENRGAIPAVEISVDIVKQG
jgi:quercetin dioxygenase-like cupin family protein